MKQLYFILALLVVFIIQSQPIFAQPSAATDFTLSDCEGTEHHLFSQLDSNHVVAMEFVMGCLPCVQGRKALTRIEQTFSASHPGKFQVYTFGFSGDVDCSSIQSWMTQNNFTGACFGGNDYIVADYGATGGMPTIVVVGGTDHKVLYWKKGFSNKDTTAIIAAISQGLTSQSSVATSSATAELTSVYPNPSASTATVSITCPTTASLEIALFNATGTKILSIHNGYLSAGTHSLDFSTKAVANGSYYVRVTTANGAASVVPLTIVH